VPEPLPEPLLRVENLVRRFGGIIATDNLSLEFARGELHAIIGPNGAGKTTLISQLIGQLRPSTGSIRFAGEDITHLPAWRRSRLGLARSFQITSLLRDFTAADNVALAAQARDGHSFRFWGNARKERQLRDEAQSALARVGLGHRGEALVSELSHGEQRELELAVALANRPRLLLMDEPTAGMAPRERIELMRLTARIAREQSIGVLFTEHDMDVVFEHADRILVLNRGTVIAEGPPEEVRRNREVRAIYLGEGLVYDARHRGGAPP